LLSQALEIFQEEVKVVKNIPGLVPNFICYPIQRNAIAAMRQRGGNALGIDRDEPLFRMWSRGQVLSTYLLTFYQVILISTAWTNRTDDVDVNRMTANIIARVNATAQGLGVANRYELRVGSAGQLGICWLWR
jgi:hypothetical protein